MRYFIISLVVFMTGLITACNTIGGLGQDLSETGKALDKAAFWSQNQIDEISQDSSVASPNTSNNSELVVQEPDTLRQY